MIHSLPGANSEGQMANGKRRTERNGKKYNFMQVLRPNYRLWCSFCTLFVLFHYFNSFFYSVFGKWSIAFLRLFNFFSLWLFGWCILTTYEPILMHSAWFESILPSISRQNAGKFGWKCEILIQIRANLKISKYKDYGPLKRQSKAKCCL